MEAINKENAGEKKIFNSSEIKDIFNAAIRKLKIKNWHSVVEPKAKDISINPKHKKGNCVEIPISKRADLYSLEALVNHEIATHLSRNNSGELSPLRLLSFLGADHYHATEEGLALYAEQVSYKRRGLLPKKANPLASLAIGAAIEGRNFRKTFNFLINLGAEPEIAWHHTFRVFRGVRDTSKSLGFINTSDYRYRRGNLEVAEFIKKNGVRALDKLWVGKIGIKHLPLMAELGITQPAVKRRYLKFDDLLS